jgi:hypothetical protein
MASDHLFFFTHRESPIDSRVSRLTGCRKLYNILWTVLDSLYCQNFYQSGPLQIFDLMSRIAFCEQELDNWVVNLPSPFRMVEIDTEERAGYAAGVSANLVTVLRLRYYGVRNLIHRPVLERFLSLFGDLVDTSCTQANDFNHTVISCQHSLQVCVTSSAEIMLLANSFGHGQVVPGMWWTSLYFGKF